MKKEKARSRKPPAPEEAPAYPMRVMIPAVAVAVLVVAASFNLYGGSKNYQKANRDAYGVAAQVERFRPAAEVLPPASAIGYLSDIPTAETAGRAAFLSAQYALAPRLLVAVDSAPLPERAIGNFSKPVDYAAGGRMFGFAVERDMGNGVVLYKRAGR
jgi:hypothetical protein